ncbi:MAG TPA: hypothetical protein VKU82_00690 [Planctomycetaceae bacterium]|nr:hypothetical protein [Planctomycetaceae bacterium]
MRRECERPAARFAAIAAGLCLIAALAAQAAERAGDESSVGDSARVAEIADDSGALDRPPEKRSVSLALFMLGGIIVAGTLLLALVVMWGNRTRRLARRPLPGVSKRDDLWFLRPAKTSEPQIEQGMPPEPESGIEPETK